mmetsp:Transcript_5153/g.8095  ORF Transcript_5153/g.8095 Transcript_5153/m.8095 type:complete len:146 (-) Transcript_5153:482-919(-)
MVMVPSRVPRMMLLRNPSKSQWDHRKKLKGMPKGRFWTRTIPRKFCADGHHGCQYRCSDGRLCGWPSSDNNATAAATNAQLEWGSDDDVMAKACKEASGDTPFVTASESKTNDDDDDYSVKAVIPVFPQGLCLQRRIDVILLMEA